MAMGVLGPIQLIGDDVVSTPRSRTPSPIFPATQDVMNAWQSRSDDYSLVQCGMLYSVEPRLQKCFEQHRAYEMFQELKMVFQAHARVERYEVSDKFYSCKMEENSSVSEHILKQLIFQMTRSLTESSSNFHLATRAL